MCVFWLSIHVAHECSHLHLWICVSAVSMCQKIQAATDLVANQPIKKKSHKLLKRLQHEHGQLNLSTQQTHKHTQPVPWLGQLSSLGEKTVTENLTCHSVCVLVFVVFNLCVLNRFCVFCWDEDECYLFFVVRLRLLMIGGSWFSLDSVKVVSMCVHHVWRSDLHHWYMELVSINTENQDSLHPPTHTHTSLSNPSTPKDGCAQTKMNRPLPLGLMIFES